MYVVRETQFLMTRPREGKLTKSISETAKQASASESCVPQHPLWEAVPAAVRAMLTVYYNVALLPVPGQSKAHHLRINTARELRVIFTFLNAREKNIS